MNRADEQAHDRGGDVAPFDENERQKARRVMVSVVIPVKDDRTELVRCLAALRTQTRRADEIVVVDNASQDDSASVAISDGAVVVSCPEPGIPAASSRGYDTATGDVILRLDADCVPPLTWIAEVVETFEVLPEVSALTGSARFIDGPPVLRTPLAMIYLFAYTVAAGAALGHRPLFGSNLAMRRDAWQAIRESVHRHDPELHDDLDLSFHLGEQHLVRRMNAEAMGISMRPFRSVSSFRRRIARGFRTVVEHWPADFPPMRWRRIIGSRRHASAA